MILRCESGNVEPRLAAQSYVRDTKLGRRGWFDAFESSVVDALLG